MARSAKTRLHDGFPDDSRGVSALHFTGRYSDIGFLLNQAVNAHLSANTEISGEGRAVLAVADLVRFISLLCGRCRLLLTKRAPLSVDTVQRFGDNVLRQRHRKGK